MSTFVKEFENYILSDFCEETLATLVPGSESEYFIKLIRKINNMEQEDPEKLKEILFKFLDENPYSSVSARLRLTYLVKKYDLKSTTPQEKEEILNQINEKFYNKSLGELQYSKHINLAQNNVKIDEEHKYSSILDEKTFSAEDYLNTLYDKNIQYITQNLSTELICENLPWLIDFNRFSDEVFLDILNQNSSSYPKTCLLKLHIYDDKLIEKLARMASRVNTDKYYEAQLFIQNVHTFMTNSQLELFISLLPADFNKDQIVSEIIKRKFNIPLSKADNELERRKILIQIYDYLKEKPLTFNSMRCDTLLLILENGIKTKIYDLVFFKAYLENPIFLEFYNNDEKKTQQIQQWSSNRQNICSIQIKSGQEEKKIIEKYLRHFFLNENLKYEEFISYFKPDFLLKIYQNYLVLKGEEDESAIKSLTEKVYQELVKKTELTICEHNKEKFDLNETISLEVDIKNVSTLFVKIFEINTENYYYNKKETLNTAISLEGLIASHELTFSFAEKPQKLVRRTFDFDVIGNKRGIYIIEFIGNGFSSRAIIKKGSLSLVHRATVNGKFLFILDEEQNIVKGPTTGVWIKSQFYKCEDSGAIVIPYQLNDTNESVILVHDNFAEITSLTLETENYRLEGTFVVNNESILMGNLTKLIFRPNLFINNRPADLKHLINPKLTITLIKTENDQDIPITNVFDGESIKSQLRDNKDIEVEFSVPPRLQSLNLSFTAEVKNKSQDKLNELNVTKSQAICLPNNYNNKYSKVFLHKVDGKYILTLLGRNGEPRPNVILNLKISHQYRNILRKDFPLQTDEEGKIFLGELNDVNLITVNSQYKDDNIMENFLLGTDNIISYPSRIDIIEGEEIKIPLEINPRSMRTFFFHKVSDSCVLENLTSCVEISEYQNSNHRNAILKNLKEGTYILGWNLMKRTININVYKGQYWDSENFIKTSSKIIENSGFKYPIHLEQFNYSEGKLKLKVNSKGKNPRVHLIANKFISNLESSACLSILKTLLSSVNFNNFSFQNWKNIFLSNRLLNEEIQYVLDRKHNEKTMGNSLEKPSMLVKRQFVRDTTTVVQEAKQGGEYERRHIEMANNNKESCARMKKMRVSSYSERDTFSEEKNINFDNLLESACFSEPISTFHNFLAFSPIIIPNLSPDENGEINIDIDLTKHSILNALVVDSCSVYSENLYLNKSFEQVSRRDLTMTLPLPPEKYFSELRKTKTLHVGEKFSISDITSTNFQIIDSLEKLISYYTLTPSFNNISTDWKKLNFLLNFDDLNENVKLQKWSENFSHEVNIFLYFRHPKFFAEYVRPVIKFKSEKTFVDFFLLNDQKNLKEFITPNKIDQLNAFEKCLLIFAVRGDLPELAKNIAGNMRQVAEKNKISEQELKRNFNMIMNMKMEENVIAALESKSMPLMDLDMGSNFSSAFSMPKMAMMAQPKCFMSRSPMAQKNLKMGKHGSAKQYMMEDLGESVDEDEIMMKNIRNNLPREGGKSKEYCETHYYNNVSKDFKNLIDTNLFYSDLAEYWTSDKNSYDNFITGNILEPVKNLTQFISILATIGLKVKSLSHSFERLDGRGLCITPESNMIIFTKEISETDSDIKNSIMIAQIVSKKKQISPDSVQYEENEFLINEVYKHETIVTNISNKTLNFELLIQIPQGAIPVETSEYTKTVNLSLVKFMTTKTEVYFYFPTSGTFVGHPPSASMEGRVCAKSSVKTYKVVENITISEHKSLDDVLQSGSKAEILNFIRKMKVVKINDLEKVYWMLKDKEFYENIISIMRERGLYDFTVWSMAAYHKDFASLKELFQETGNLKNILGPYADFSLIKIDATKDFNLMRHKDYHPILNSRVHRLANEKKSGILNVQLKQTYQEFITYLVGLKHIDNRNLLRLSYYLILQDRIEEAIKVFGRINKIEIENELGLQYDYISAYLDFSTGYPQFNTARKICEIYKDFPLNHWKELFEEISDQLNEYDGKGSFEDFQNPDDEKKKKQNAKLAAETEPKLSFSISNKSLDILYTNTSSLNIKFYLIDLEILFSRTPFIKQNSDDFSFVQPNFSHTLSLESSTRENQLSFNIPQEFINSNLFIEVSSQSEKCFDTYFSTSLVVNISEALGEVKVLDKNLATLSKVYVKCFAKYNNGTVKFYKDGYTDLRGKFNYVSLNTGGIQTVEKFALFISHDSLGSFIKEASPPTNIGKFTDDAEGGNLNEYDMFKNYRQEMKNQWKQSMNSKI